MNKKKLIFKVLTFKKTSLFEELFVVNKPLLFPCLLYCYAVMFLVSITGAVIKHLMTGTKVNSEFP